MAELNCYIVLTCHHRTYSWHGVSGGDSGNLPTICPTRASPAHIHSESQCQISTAFLLQLSQTCEKPAWLEAPDISVTLYASSTHTCIHLNEDNTICAGFPGSIGHMNHLSIRLGVQSRDTLVCSHLAVPQYSNHSILCVITINICPNILLLFSKRLAKLPFWETCKDCVRKTIEKAFSSWLIQYSMYPYNI